MLISMENSCITGLSMIMGGRGGGGRGTLPPFLEDTPKETEKSKVPDFKSS